MECFQLGRENSEIGECAGYEELQKISPRYESRWRTCEREKEDHSQQNSVGESQTRYEDSDKVFCES